MEWISVKERSPPNFDKPYIVYYGDWREEVRVCMWMGKYKTSRGVYWTWVSTPGFCGRHITHWMEIPSIPVSQ